MNRHAPLPRLFRAAEVPRPHKRLGRIYPDAMPFNVSFSDDYFKSVPDLTRFNEKHAAIAIEQAFQDWKEDDGFVYFLISADNGLVKIGWAGDVRRRVNEIRTLNAGEIHLLGYAQASMKMEKMLHGQFAEICHHGEWFWPHWTLLDFASWACE